MHGSPYTSPDRPADNGALVHDQALQIEVRLTEAAIAEDFLAALANRYLPERFFYWFPLSVRAWLSLCQDGPYRNYVRSNALVRANVSQVTGALPQGPVEVVSLGSGQGTKDFHLLTELAAGGRAVAYVPVDAGQTLLEMACAGAAERGLICRGIKADLTNPAHLSGLVPGRETPCRLVLLLGNTLGGFDPLDMLRRLRPLVRGHDLLLVDGELQNDSDTRAGYENPLNRAFAFAPLRSIGISESDGALVFEPRTDVRAGVHRLGKYFRADVDLALRVGGEPFNLRAGERIEMNHSGKYERGALLKLIADGGFEPRAEFLSEDRRFLMVLARPRP